MPSSISSTEHQGALSDGHEQSNQVLMYTDLTKDATKLNKVNFPIIEIKEYDILANKFVVIVSYKFVKSLKEKVGETDMIENSFFDKLQRGLINVPYTPTSMRGVLKRTKANANMRKRVLSNQLGSATKKRKIV